MKKLKGRNSILWIEAVGFSAIIALSWLAELLRFPFYAFNDPTAPNWRRAMMRMIVIGIIWAWVHLLTRQILKRLHYLEEFLRICSWCRKVNAGEEWLALENYFNSKFATRTSHGMCPECLEKKRQELARRGNAGSDPGKQED